MTTDKRYDVMVLGLGVMGSAALYFLSKQDICVAGIEQFSLGHTQGSSHGETRIIRMAYFEHSNYVPLLQRAYKLWRKLEHETDRTLMVLNGMIVAASPWLNNNPLMGMAQSAKTYGLTLQKYTSSEMRTSFPWLTIPNDCEGFFEQDAGYLLADTCVQMFQQQAKNNGAKIFLHENVLSIGAHANEIEVVTNYGTYTTQKLIVCAGSWTSILLPELNTHLKVQRVLPCWFELRPSFENATSIPCFGVANEQGFYYGFPSLDGQTMKVARHGGTAISNPADKDRVQSQLELDPILQFTQTSLPGLHHSQLKVSPCLYTMSPDEHFILGPLPSNPSICVAAGFSGHGFKFASVIGEELCNWSMGKGLSPLLDFLHPSRF